LVIDETLNWNTNVFLPVDEFFDDIYTVLEVDGVWVVEIVVAMLVVFFALRFRERVLESVN